MVAERGREGARQGREELNGEERRKVKRVEK
ncbi:hypothetical protein OIU79_021009 [Salix purpurea]|uniref:Uncharacterized protein n=1 Tax=Salix purpurea TaxID=77065 RepID=A0A9Q0WQJ0_SALPP|nr:hypothetical protein OIU79_021009 [Salix purpurea]